LVGPACTVASSVCIGPWAEARTESFRPTARFARLIQPAGGKCSPLAPREEIGSRSEQSTLSRCSCGVRGIR
jgi:hypothetical protein